MTIDVGAYCRDVESYLCRRNDGHLIRIVGPSFELVCGWAERQIPLRVVFGAVDRTLERHQAKGARSRPLRIEFCEADVLELFDEWRRAVGVGAVPTDATPTHRAVRRLSLAGHIERVVERLTSWRSANGGAQGTAEPVTRLIEDLDALCDRSRTARGADRQQLIARLDDFETQLTLTLRDLIDPEVFEMLRAEAARDLAPFRERMPREALRQAMDAGTDRLLYEHFKLPRVAFE